MKEEQSFEEDICITTKVLALPGIRKRKSLIFSRDIEAGVTTSPEKRLNSVPLTKKQIKDKGSKSDKKDKTISCKKENYVDRWSIERYKVAEKKMLEVLKAQGASFDNPISRPALRVAARKHIGDTGLLDHLLKHIDGKLAPGGTERFRRCYNTEGVMEYWLESADLVKIKRESGVPDPSRIPPSHLKASGVAFHASVCYGELTSLKEEIANIRSDMQLLASKKKGSDKDGSVLGLAKWRIATDQRLMEISSSLNSMQDINKETVTWKSKIEKQLVEISNSLTSMQASKPLAVISPASEEWDDFLNSTDFNNLQEEQFPWLGSTDLNVGHDAMLQEIYPVSQPYLKPCGSSSRDLACARELDMLKEEMAVLKRDVEHLVAKKIEEDQNNGTPESSLTDNSKLDTDNSFHMFQEMFNDMTKWKAKMEKQIMEVSSAVRTLLASST